MLTLDCINQLLRKAKSLLFNINFWGLLAGNANIREAISTLLKPTIVLIMNTEFPKSEFTSACLF